MQLMNVIVDHAALIGIFFVHLQHQFFPMGSLYVQKNQLINRSNNNEEELTEVPKSFMFTERRR